MPKIRLVYMGSERDESKNMGKGTRDILSGGVLCASLCRNVLCLEKEKEKLLLEMGG